jgi:tryptophan synthase alpha chain
VRQGATVRALAGDVTEPGLGVDRADLAGVTHVIHCAASVSFDLPLEEAAPLHMLADAKGLSPIVLMTPTSTDARLAQLGAVARGFVYCVARRGVTGASTQMDNEVSTFLSRCRAATSLPLAVGFGVSTAEDLRFIGENAEIAIIGTAALRAWEQGGESALCAFFDGLGV